MPYMIAVSLEMSDEPFLLLLLSFSYGFVMNEKTMI